MDMTSMLTCDLQVQNHVLKRNSELWPKERGRIAVQIPIPTGSTTPDIVAVRRYTKCQKENAVCLASSKAFEKDTSKVYTAEKVSQEPYVIKAHGVVLVDSSDRSDFEYRRGDKVWLYVARSSQGYEDSVPVANLRTSELGTVNVDHVCWYPTHQSGDGKLWTLGGTLQELQLEAGKKQLWSWGVWQAVDSRQAGGQMARLEEGSKSKSPSLARKLSTTTRQRHFEARLLLMESVSGTSDGRSSTKYNPPRPLPTPPFSPETKDSRDRHLPSRSPPVQPTIRFTAPYEFKNTSGDAKRANPPKRKRRRQPVDTRRRSIIEVMASASSSSRRGATPPSSSTSRTSKQATTAEIEDDDFDDDFDDDDDESHYDANGSEYRPLTPPFSVSSASSSSSRQPQSFTNYTGASSSQFSRSTYGTNISYSRPPVFSNNNGPFSDENVSRLSGLTINQSSSRNSSQNTNPIMRMSHVLNPASGSDDDIAPVRANYNYHPSFQSSVSVRREGGY